MFTAPHIQQGRIANEEMIDFLVVSLRSFRMRMFRRNLLILMLEIPGFGRLLMMPSNPRKSRRSRNIWVTRIPLDLN